MMAFDGFSFSFFEGSGFRRLSGALQSQAGLVANRSKVVAWIDETAARIRSFIAAELQNRMFTISADIASRFGHRILGVMAQFLDCGKVIHRVLAIMPLTNRHTAINIADEIKLVLAVYDREICEAYSFGVDNAINMVNAGYLLSETQRERLREFLESLQKSVGYESEDSDLLLAGYGMYLIFFSPRRSCKKGRKNCKQTMRAAHTQCKCSLE